MLRPSPLWMVIALLGGIAPAARAQQPMCPTQASAPAAAASTAAPAAAPPAAAQAPPGAESSAAPPGSVDVTSDEASLGLDGSATLRGNVEVRQGAREIHANQLQYNPQNEAVRSDGHIDYNDPLVHVAGEGGGSYSTSEGAEFKGAHFDLHQRSARGAAAEMSVTPDGVLRLKDVTFTTCPANDNSWQIRADSIVLDTRSQTGTGRDARVDFKGVPVVYLPWFSFPLGSERKSGFLFPSVGNSTYGGVQLATPYYWNIAPNVDFTFQPTLYSRSGADLGGDLRFLGSAQRGELQWNFLPDDTVYGGSRSRVQFNDVAELPGDFRLTLDAQNISDPLYFQDFSQTPEGTSTAFLDRRATLSYRSEHWTVDGEAQQYQTIDDTLPVYDRPYARVPRLAVSSTYGLYEVLHYGFESELVDFQHAATPTGTALVPAVQVPTGWRGDFTPALSADLTGPGYFVRPALAWRLTQYELNNLLPGEQRSPSRVLPIASFDTGLLFERASGSRDQRKLTLEPRVLYLEVPYRRQDQLPVFDTGLPDLTPIELFNTNRYVGADRVSDANQMSAGITSRLLDARDGRQFLAVTFGQSYYFTIPRVTLPGETPLAGRHSDFVAQLALTAFQDWNADMGVQWDPQNQRSERTQVRVQYRPAGDSVINLAYRYQRFVQVADIIQGLPQPCLAPGVPPPPGVPLLCDNQGFDQVDASGAWPIRRNWSGFVRDVYSVRDGKELERFAGFEYRSCCWRLRLGARRYVSSFYGRQDSAVWLQLELAGLAGVGSASDTSLTEEIRGYTPPDAATQRIRAP